MLFMKTAFSSHLQLVRLIDACVEQKLLVVHIHLSHIAAEAPHPHAESYSSRTAA